MASHLAVEVLSLRGQKKKSNHLHMHSMGSAASMEKRANTPELKNCRSTTL